MVKIEEPTCCCIRKRTCCVLTIQLFFIILVGGILCLALVPYLIHTQIEEELTVAGPRAGLYSSWRNATSQNVTVKNIYHFFHIKNPYEIETFGATPEVELRGPYVYHHIKAYPEEYIRWYADGTVEYRDEVRNVFMPEESIFPNEDEVICGVRIGIFGAIQQGAAGMDGVSLEPIILEAIKLSNVTSIFTNKTVSQLIHGYNELVLELLADVFSLLGVSLSTQVAFDPDIPSAANQNAQRIYSGGKASKTQPTPPKYSLGDYVMNNGMTTLPYWGSEEANTIRGSGATLYAPLMMLDTSRKLYAYVSDVRRSIVLQYSSRETDSGISVNRYRLDKELFYDGQTVPANAAYYITHTGLQPKPPVKNSTSGEGLPPRWIFMAISKAMFLDCDMTGLNVKLPRPANKEEDDIFLDYEPITSTLLQAHKRLQLNVNIKKVTLHDKNGTGWDVNATNNLPESWIPVFKFDETATLPQKDKDTLKNDVLVPLLAVLVVGILATIIGVVGLIISCWQLCRTPTLEQLIKQNKSETTNLLGGGNTNRDNTSSDSIAGRNDSYSYQGRELQYGSQNNNNNNTTEDSARGRGSW